MAVKLKDIDFQEAKKLLVEKAAATEETIQGKLGLNYELEFTIEMEKEGLSKELCETIGVGRPKGKTMLSGCIAFTVHNDAWIEGRLLRHQNL